MSGLRDGGGGLKEGMLTQPYTLIPRREKKVCLVVYSINIPVQFFMAES